MAETLADLQKIFENEISYFDDTAQIILKGHLVAEDLMNQALEAYVHHGEHVGDARLQFNQKLELCKSISVSENKNNMWNLIKKLNVVRNALSHSLDVERREKAINSLRSIYDQEFDIKYRNIEGLSEEAALCQIAMAGALGFLHSFLSEAQRFEGIVKSINLIMNNGSSNKTA